MVCAPASACTARSRARGAQLSGRAHACVQESSQIKNAIKEQKTCKGRERNVKKINIFKEKENRTFEAIIEVENENPVIYNKVDKVTKDKVR